MKKIAIYMRLSIEECSMEKIENESNSILSQRILINDFIKNNNLQSIEQEEYIDDGYSGTNTKRPSFQRLISDIKDNKIYCIITKDFSRFSRDYILMGDFLENILPFMNVRFISVNDNYDSIKEKGNGINLDVQFKTLLYDFYSKDISQKIKSAVITLKRQGKYINSNAPFGYKKDPNNKYNIIIDSTASRIVRSIFDFALKGLSTREIAKIMNKEKFKTPQEIITQRKLSKNTNLDLNKDAKIKSTKLWRHYTILNILKNENYTGDYVFNLTSKISVGSNAINKNPKEKWERIENHHEGIVSKEEFKKVREILSSKKTFKSHNNNNNNKPRSKNTLHTVLLQGILKCDKCNYTLSRIYSRRIKKDGSVSDYSSFSCDNCISKKEKKSRLKNKDIEKEIFNIIMKKEKEQSKQKNKIHSDDDNTKKQLKKLEYNIQKLELKKINTYDSYKMKNITKYKFLELKEKIDFELKIFKKRLQMLEDEVKENFQDKKNEIKIKLEKEKKLTKEMVEKYIDKIYINLSSSSKISKIVWKC